jgi:integrase
VGADNRVTSDVRVWTTRRYKGTRGTTYTVRWGVAAKHHQRTFATAKLAETFRTDLLLATRQGVQFRLDDGLPQDAGPPEPEPERTWLEHARDYVAAKWPAASPRHRRAIAEALTDITLALVANEQGLPPSVELRTALYRHAFNASTHVDPVPDRLRSAMAWIEQHSPPLARLNEAIVLRDILNRLARRQDGSPAAAATVSRKRATLHSVLQYAVELELFPSNPLKKIQWRAPQPTDAVDRRLVVNPGQARALLSAVRQADPAVAAFFACLYYAGLRPAEARNLRAEDCTLPETGWGTLLLTGSHQTSDLRERLDRLGHLQRGPRPEASRSPGHQTRPSPSRAGGVPAAPHRDLPARHGRSVVRDQDRSSGCADLTAVPAPRVHGHHLPSLAPSPRDSPDRTSGPLPARAEAVRPASCLPLDQAERRCPTGPGSRVGGTQRRGAATRLREVRRRRRPGRPTTDRTGVGLSDREPGPMPARASGGRSSPKLPHVFPTATRTRPDSAAESRTGGRAARHKKAQVRGLFETGGR